MHYFQFNIADYISHTTHLSEIEDLAYRRMIEWCYLHERPLPKNLEQISKLIRMRSHTEAIKSILSEFFSKTEKGYIQQRISNEIEKYQKKSQSARDSANARWNSKLLKDKESDICERNARTECERNANHKPITNNQEPYKHNGESVDPPIPRKPVVKVPYAEIVNLYQEKLPMLNGVAKLTDTRKRYIKKLWTEDSLPDLENWSNFFDYVSGSKFLIGNGPPNNGGKPFKADLEWITKPANYVKILEGKYHE